MIDITAAKNRLAELEQQRADLADRRQEQAAVVAAAAAAHRAAVALADLQGQLAPVAPALNLPELPDPAGLDARCAALKAAIADAEEAAELERLGAMHDDLDRLDGEYKAAMLAFVRFYAERALLLRRWEILYAKAQRRAGRYASDPPSRPLLLMIPPEKIAGWLSVRGEDGVTAAQIAVGELTLEEFKAQRIGGNRGN